MRKLVSVIAILLVLIGSAQAQEPILFGAPNQGVVTAQQTYNGTAGQVAMSFTLFATVFTAINDPLENAVNGVVTSLVGYVRAGLQPVILLALVLAGLAV